MTFSTVLPSLLHWVPRHYNFLVRLLHGQNFALILQILWIFYFLFKGEFALVNILTRFRMSVVLKLKLLFKLHRIRWQSCLLAKYFRYENGWIKLKNYCITCYKWFPASWTLLTNISGLFRGKSLSQSSMIEKTQLNAIIFPSNI